MHLSENEGIEGHTFVVTGGAGFVGTALCLELMRRGADEVRSFDLRKDSPWLTTLRRNGVVCITGDVSRKEDVEKALQGVDCVFHLASYGMSGKEMLQAGRIDQVNINGTCHVLEACNKHGVRRLVYTSTYNVVYGGKEIVNGNESLQYFPLDDHVDPYGRSKALAEQLILKSNARPLKKRDGKKLYTCAIRPAAIYGPGEERHLPRIFSLGQMGLLTFKIGEPRVKNDWVYVDNLVHALLLASMGLLDDIPGREGTPVAAGQAYFISDGSPVNSFEFLRPLIASLEYTFPKITISVPTALTIAWSFWGIYSLCYPWLNKTWFPRPLILPAEVYKVGVTHYFSILKANQELGYIPIVKPEEGMKTTITYWKEKKKMELDTPNIFIWLYITLGMFQLFCVAFIPLPYLGPLKWVRWLGILLFRSVRNLQILFYVATLLHVGEAIYAYFLAQRVDQANARGWFWQTFALGFPSLRLLLKRAKQ
uniref:Putative NAD(P)-binding Rossmann-fold superfamily protein n=2 Tax=Juniperus TaxID=13100 RepID=A0A3S6KJI0_JUNSC|nr:putative NAD(P)-binding Rossmann-fold superfamily protein [Juniperus drupacea]ATB19694.1 putative NAD(P)-binding Rossmann-fold superfamily protein [Juniperus scopulorum]